MPTHVDEAITDVFTEPDPESGNEKDGDTRWKDWDRTKKMIARIKCLELRTKAEGFDD